jgi:hypothetical protein
MWSSDLGHQFAPLLPAQARWGAIRASTLLDVFVSRKAVSIVSDDDLWSFGDEYRPCLSESTINFKASRAS